MDSLIPKGDKSARELAVELVPFLETVANLHYLLDWHVETPERLKELRVVEDEAFNSMYTSILNADTSTLVLAREHQATEAYIRTSGVPFTFLRNGWYTENQTQAIGAALAHGAILGAAKDGRFSAAACADYAAAAVAVLTGNGHENKAYELGGDESYTLTDLAAEVARRSKKTVIYQDLPQQEYAGALVGFGLPEGLADGLADADACASRGELYTKSHDLSTLIGRATTPMQESVTAALPL